MSHDQLDSALSLCDIQCPNCGKYSLVENEGKNSLRCRECECKIFRNVFSHTLTADDFRHFAREEPTRYYGNLRRRDGSIYGGRFVFRKATSSRTGGVQIWNNDCHNCSDDIIPEVSKKFFDVFISHSSKDNEQYIKIKEYLEEHGISAYGDSELNPGQDYQKILLSMIRCSRFLLVLISKNSVQDEHQWIRSELRTAQKSEIPIIPCLIEDIQDFGAIYEFVGNLHFARKEYIPSVVSSRRENEIFNVYVMYDNACKKDLPESSYLYQNLTSYRNILSQIFMTLNQSGCSYISECSIADLNNTLQEDMENEDNILNSEFLRQISRTKNDQFFRKFYSSHCKVVLIVNHPEFVVTKDREELLNLAFDRHCPVLVCPVSENMDSDNLQKTLSLTRGEYISVSQETIQEKIQQFMSASQEKEMVTSVNSNDKESGKYSSDKYPSSGSDEATPSSGKNMLGSTSRKMLLMSLIFLVVILTAIVLVLK